MDPQEIAVGMAVRMLNEASSIGEVLKRDGPRVRVDFSRSGGSSSSWVTAKDLAPAAAADVTPQQPTDGGGGAALAPQSSLAALSQSGAFAKAKEKAEANAVAPAPRTSFVAKPASPSLPRAHTQSVVACAVRLSILTGCL